MSDIRREEQPARGIRFSSGGADGEVARAYLYIMTNDLHDAPFGLLEDVFVAESERGSGLGTALVNEVIAAARAAGCYKLVATSRASRPKVHELYERLGFANYGIEFRLNFEPAGGSPSTTVKP
jgi:GNAT superfamily N-acetyltransferase